MSYSFSVQKANKEEALLAVRDKLVEVMEQQPLHKDDGEQAFNAAESLIKLLQDDGDRDIYCSMSGSIWKTEAGVQSLTLNVSVGFKTRE